MSQNYKPNKNQGKRRRPENNGTEGAYNSLPVDGNIRKTIMNIDQITLGGDIDISKLPKSLQSIVESYRAYENSPLSDATSFHQLNQSLFKYLSGKDAIKDRDGNDRQKRRYNAITAAFRQLQQDNPSANTGADLQTRVDRVNWDSEEQVRSAMNDGVPPTLEKQNDNNALVWYNTIFKKDPTNPRQAEILDQQQDFMVRNFLAQAYMELQGGDQNNKKFGYDKLENFTNDRGSRVNLATVSSGGGRVNYRSTDGSGQEFENFLTTGNPKTPLPRPKANKKLTDNIGGATISKDDMGAFIRDSTHNESFNQDDYTIREGKSRFGTEAIGFDIPIGGVGQRLVAINGKDAITGYQGRSQKNKYQTGSGFIRSRHEGDLSNVMTAFEGSSPHTKNIHGGSHEVVDTLKKVVGGGASSKTLTGQGKRSTWNLVNTQNPGIGGVDRMGGIKVDGLGTSIVALKGVYDRYNSLPLERQQDFMKKLLVSETQDERDNLLRSLYDPA